MPSRRARATARRGCRCARTAAPCARRTAAGRPQSPAPTRHASRAVACTCRTWRRGSRRRGAAAGRCASTASPAHRAASSREAAPRPARTSQRRPARRARPAQRRRRAAATARAVAAADRATRRSPGSVGPRTARRRGRSAGSARSPSRRAVTIPVERQPRKRRAGTKETRALSEERLLAGEHQLTARLFAP